MPKLNACNCSLYVPEMCEKITSVCQVLKGMHTEENGFSFLLHGVADLRVGLYCLRPIHPRSI